MSALALIPTKAEFDLFAAACGEMGFVGEAESIGRIDTIHFAEQMVTIAQAGLGKTQFAITTRHLIDAGPEWDIIYCAGAAGGMTHELARLA